ncbi:hypothetical protein DL96DRAFT_1624038 [Flagelloscypha sp. PMI_526]|nr:hypothetical protein DL96DRAFT_1624038 [Flagelloscypha sp. PMI_526]
MLLPSNDGIKHSQCHCRHQCRAHNGAILDSISCPSGHSNDVTSPPSYSQSSTNSPPSSSISTSSSTIALGILHFQSNKPDNNLSFSLNLAWDPPYTISSLKSLLSRRLLSLPSGEFEVLELSEVIRRLDGRDSIIIAKKRFCRSKCFSSKMINSSQCPRQLVLRYQERWTRDLTIPRRRVVLYPELEILHLEGIDERITSVVLMVLEQQEKVNDLFTGRTMTGLLSNYTHTTPAASVTNALD